MCIPYGAKQALSGMRRNPFQFFSVILIRRMVTCVKEKEVIQDWEWERKSFLRGIYYVSSINS